MPESKGMGVVLADFNNDGWPDIAIANDTWPNFLFQNNHDGTFSDESRSSQVWRQAKMGATKREWASTPLMWMATGFSMSTLRILILS